MDELERWSPGDLPDRALGGVAGAGVGILVTLAFGPVAGALAAGATTPALERASKFARSALERKLGRAERAVSCAAASAGWSADDLLEHAIADDRRAELVSRALGAAAASMTDAKIDALGRAMAAGVLASDDAKVDEVNLVVEALAQLEAADLRLLMLMASEEGSAGKTRESWSRSHMEEKALMLAPVLDSLIARLSAAGVITDAAQGWSFQTFWRVTEFGRTCLAYLADRQGTEGQR